MEALSRFHSPRVTDPTNWTSQPAMSGPPPRQADDVQSYGEGETPLVEDPVNCRNRATVLSRTGAGPPARPRTPTPSATSSGVRPCLSLTSSTAPFSARYLTM